MYKTSTVWKKRFNGWDMKHPINLEMYAYTMYAITLDLRKFSFSQKIKTSLLLSAQRHDLSSNARRLNRQKKKRKNSLKICRVESAASIQRFKWRVSRPWNASLQAENGNVIQIYRDPWIVRWTLLKQIKLIANADNSHWKTT